MSLPSLVAFGPQTAAPAGISLLAKLRCSLQTDARLRTFSRAIQNLPRTWDHLVASDTSLSDIEGQVQLGRLSRCLSGNGEVDDDFSDLSTLPNIILTPLTLIIHVTGYFHYLKEQGISHQQLLDEARHGGGFQGFCTGLFAAISLSVSYNTEEVVEMAVIALRLSAAVGAYVDLDSHLASPSGVAVSLSIRWKLPQERDRILAVLDEFDDVYISVISDVSAMTVTVTPELEGSLTQKLGETGVTVRKVPLSGRFHTYNHQLAVEKLLSLCGSNSLFRFPTDLQPLCVVKTGTAEVKDMQTSLHHVLLKSMLLEQSEWYNIISTSVQSAAEANPYRKTTALSIGVDSCIPRSVASTHNLKVVSSALLDRSTRDEATFPYPDDSIAIVGMAGRFPGADTLEEFWHLLLSGSSMLGQLPSDRFPTTGLRRSPKSDRPFLGNFLKDAYAFDHKFFNRSPRESSSMDPQHKLALQAAYEALESAGYFSNPSAPIDVGCYMGVAASDYEDNVGSHTPTAFSVTGAVRAFTSGKVSHFFGFSGPSIVFDTACSSSAVAIHTACQAIRSGDCSMALAGGVNVITSPTLHQNLAAANFLSPNGASKAFDARADGYCRGEGVAILVLKKLSAAIADGDSISGVIASSAVNQNANSAAITVPVSESQTSLYRKLLRESHMDAEQISFVEAHGTGTPKGDPIETASIREVFGNQPSRKLYFGSVKGSIGHLEGASGAAAIIKVLLMMHHRMVVPQASFETLNPNIPPLGPSNMEIPRSATSWKGDFLAACVNNYGAAGSNAALLICQPPAQKSIETQSFKSDQQDSSHSYYPVMMSAISTASLKAKCRALVEFLNRQAEETPEQLLADVAYWLARHQNLDLPCSWQTKVRSLDDLRHELSVYISSTAQEEAPKPSRTGAVVLVFPGQIGSTVSFSQQAYHSSLLLQGHIDRCDRIFRSLGRGSILPVIFSQQPIANIVDLHWAMFTIQYSCAKAWIDAGLQVKALVGHSFGQLTALCVSGAVSLEDGLKLIAGRASLVAERWGPEKGAMLSVKADRNTTERLVSEANRQGIDVEIACFNGPTAHVVVGTDPSITAFECLVSEQKISPSSAIHVKRLGVTHGFHSRLVDSILADYKALLANIHFGTPTIPVETCSTGSSWDYISAELVAAQSREPVYFGEAVARIHARFGLCAWVEAGSGGTGKVLARQALTHISHDHSFHSINLSSPQTMDQLAEVTLDLWKLHVKVLFWPFHRSQKHEYSTLHLPPYQFEKHRHWLEYIDRHDSNISTPIPTVIPSEPVKMVTLTKLVEKPRRIATFDIYTGDTEFDFLIRGHSVLGSPLCPISLYIEVASRAVVLVTPELSHDEYSSRIQDLEILAPLGLDDERKVEVLLEQKQDGIRVWAFTVSSYPREQPSKRTRHASAEIGLVAVKDPQTKVSFERIQRLIRPEKCEAILSDETSAAIQGPLVYKMFDKVVNYSDIYRGVLKMSCKEQDVAGYVSMPTIEQGRPESASSTSISNPLAVDCFTQVAGLYVNGRKDCGNEDVYICSKVSELNLALDLHTHGTSRGPWLIYSNCTTGGERQLLNDIYVFDATSRKLVMSILSVSFTKTNIQSLQKVLSRANKSSDQRPQSHVSPTLDRKPNARAAYKLKTVEEDWTLIPFMKREKPQEPSKDMLQKVKTAVRKLLYEIADVPAGDIHDTVVLSQIGIDSLMATEVINAISDRFGVQLPSSELLDMNFQSLCALVEPQDTDTNSSGGSPTYDDESSSAQSVVTTPEYSDSESPTDVARLYRLLAEHLDISETVSVDLRLSEAGVDSLMGIELGSVIEDEFGVLVDITKLPGHTTIGDLIAMVIPQSPKKKDMPPRKTKSKPPVLPEIEKPLVTEDSELLVRAVEDFRRVKNDIKRFAREAGYEGFRKNVYPKQRKLVLEYVVRAFTALGCPLASIAPGEVLPIVRHIPKHDKVVGQYYQILEHESLVRREKGKFVRTELAFDENDPETLYKEISTMYPQHAGELKLLKATGSKLSDVLSGTIDPIQILFGTKADRELLQDVYNNSPMWLTGTKVLANFFTKALSRNRVGSATINILELGAGTGGTTRHILDTLSSLGIDFKYTFTDISSSLVGAAKRMFAHYGDKMEYAVLDIEKSPPKDKIGRYHVVLSSNCIHATRNLNTSCSQIRSLLREDGLVCLLELTRNLPWLDCVFGLLEGWWLFDDGREHALADEHLWEETLLSAGFRHVEWSDDDTAESDQYRLIVGFASTPASYSGNSTPNAQSKPLITQETVEYDNVGGISLQADIYYPLHDDDHHGKRPIALMIHGGGHIMLSRKEIRPRQTKLLLDRGLLPVSIDYRLCPEVTITEGPMTDVCAALQWARRTLPELVLSRRDVRPDGDRVVVIGWSTGGTLALTLGWEPITRGLQLQPPAAILAFYCPSDYQSSFFQSPNFPHGTTPADAAREYDLLEGVRDSPITAYNIPSYGKGNSTGAWMSLEDPRSRIALHMNWMGQTLPTIMDGLPSSKQAATAGADLDWMRRPQPDLARIAEISPLARVVAGDYRTPTFIIHGTADDLVPWQHSVKLKKALAERDIPSGAAIVQDAIHLFDLYPDKEGKHWKAVVEGYEFLFSQVGL